MSDNYYDVYSKIDPNDDPTVDLDVAKVMSEIVNREIEIFHKNIELAMNKRNAELKGKRIACLLDVRVVDLDATVLKNLNVSKKFGEA